MYFKATFRRNPDSGQSCPYYRLVESYRNIQDRICHRTILNVGFISENLTAEDLNIIQKRLTQLANGIEELFETIDPVLQVLIDKYWSLILKYRKVDVHEKNNSEESLVYSESIKHTDAREVGAEHIGNQTLNFLDLKGFLKKLNWNDQKIQLTYTQIISRAVFPHSEYKTNRWIKDNSGICELTGYSIDKMTKDKLYQNALDLYSIKDDLEQYFSSKTNELFDLEDKIILFDLTNTYFEGRKTDSDIAKYGRSKEKRKDAKLVVLAMVINTDGFPKYTQILEGNTSDSSSLPKMIDQLRIKTSDISKKATVVIDAGIATEENLKLIENKGYDYVCVSRSKIKDYKFSEANVLHKIKTQSKEEITLKKASSTKLTDYILQVNSPGKKLKEDAMRLQFETRFEEELFKIKGSLDKKSGVKRYDKVNQRIGRATQKFPSVSKYYDVTVIEKEGIAIDLKYEKNSSKSAKEEDSSGAYFIRTSLMGENEENVWKIYNTIREIESTFRCLKTDIDIRPIYHKKDSSTMAHLHLAILAYWLVNTVRYQLKTNNINSEWKEIVRIANTQKIVYSTAKNKEGNLVEIIKCTEPKEDLRQIYEVLKMKQKPFVKKSVVHKDKIKNQQTIINRGSPG